MSHLVLVCNLGSRQNTISLWKTIPATPVWWLYKARATRAVFTGAKSAPMGWKQAGHDEAVPCMTAVQHRDGVSFLDVLTGEGQAMPPELQHSHNPATVKLPSVTPAATTEPPRCPGSARPQLWARLQRITRDLVAWENWKGYSFQKLAEHVDLFHCFPLWVTEARTASIQLTFWLPLCLTARRERGGFRSGSESPPLCCWGCPYHQLQQWKLKGLNPELRGDIRDVKRMHTGRKEEATLINCISKNMLRFPPTHTVSAALATDPRQ